MPTRLTSCDAAPHQSALAGASEDLQLGLGREEHWPAGLPAIDILRLIPHLAEDDSLSISALYAQVLRSYRPAVTSLDTLDRSRALRLSAGHNGPDSKSGSPHGLVGGIILIMRSWPVWSVALMMNCPLRYLIRGYGCGLELFWK